jgi:hypothetical protein
MDAGFGSNLTLFDGFSLLLAGTTRFHKAVSEPFDMLGAAGLVLGRFQMHEALRLGLSLKLGVDHYYRSGGVQGFLAFKTQDKRTDLSGMTGLFLTYPLGRDWRLGVSYEWSFRVSTADATNNDYGYNEHRLLFSIKGSLLPELFGPDVKQRAGHVSLDYGLEDGDHAFFDNENWQDLLRQNESLQPADCGCKAGG